MCNNHKHFMQAAIDEAEKNLLTYDGGPFGAVIVKDGKIIARGHNEVLKIIFQYLFYNKKTKKKYDIKEKQHCISSAVF